MALCNLLSVLLFFSLFPLFLQAQISFPDDNVTYWSPGSVVKLPWTYNFPKAQILAVEIAFIKSGSSTPVTLAEGFSGANATSKDPSKFTIEGQATLVFKNANLGHNGSYALAVTLRGAGQRKSEVKVVILEQPNAEIVFSKENEIFYRECKSDVGNPPPLAYWSKHGKKIGDFGYETKKLTLDNITKGEAAIYSCNVKSHNLTDRENITLEAPKITSFLSVPKDVVPLNTRVTLTCKADGILPTMFNISFNGKDPEINESGIQIINTFIKDNVGTYKCIAFNIIGSSIVKELKLNVTDEPITKPTIKSTTTKISPKSETTEKPVPPTPKPDPSGLADWVIPVSVIGGLAAITVIVVLIGCLCGWETFCCCKRNGGCSKNAEREQIPEHVAGGSGADSLPRANDDNQYESVDQEKLRRAAEANNGENSGAASGSSPPVYAVVDQDKKKRERERKEKEKRAPQPTYASLDPVALQPDSSKMRDRSREETNYASINLDSLQSDPL